MEEMAFRPSFCWEWPGGSSHNHVLCHFVFTHPFFWSHFQ